MGSVMREMNKCSMREDAKKKVVDRKPVSG